MATPIEGTLSDLYGPGNDDYYVSLGVLRYRTNNRRRSVREWLTDTTGSTDQRDNFNAALQACKNNTFRLVIDCPIKISVGADPSKPIFLDHGMVLEWDEGGQLILDNAYVPAFAIVHCRGVEWHRPAIIYSGGIFDAGAGWGTAGNSFNDTTLKAWLTANRGITFSSGNPLWTGSAGVTAMLFVNGNSDFSIFDANVSVPTEADAGLFIPVFTTFGAQWKEGSTITSSTGISSNTAIIPSQGRFERLMLDGCWMGHVGTVTSYRFEDITSKRYSDCQSLGGSNVGGTSYFFPPPHLFYFNDQSSDLVSSNNYLRNVLDQGVLSGNLTTVRSPSSSGYCNSLKISAHNNIIRGYTSYRRDGFADILAGDGLQLSDVYSEHDSTLFTAEVGFAIPLRFPIAPYLNMKLHNVTLVDRAAKPNYFPIGNIPGASSRANSLTAFKCKLKDCPPGNRLGFALAGVGGLFEGEFDFDTFTSTTTYLQLIPSLGSYGTAINIEYRIRINGWRATAIGDESAEPRIIAGPGNRVCVHDAVNFCEINIDNGLKTVKRTQRITVSPPAGGQFTTSLSVPSTWYPAGSAAKIMSTVGGATGLTVGFTGTGGPAALATLTSTIFNSAGSRNGTPNLLAADTVARTVVVTNTGPNFDGTGSLQIALAIEQVSVSE